MRPTEWEVIEITEMYDDKGNMRSYKRSCGRYRARSWSSALKEYLFCQYMDALKHGEVHNGIRKLTRYVCHEIKKEK